MADAATLVEIWRGSFLESAHRGHASLKDPQAIRRGHVHILGALLQGPPPKGLPVACWELGGLPSLTLPPAGRSRLARKQRYWRRVCVALRVCCRPVSPTCWC